jgi:hypothetical protein
MESTVVARAIVDAAHAAIGYERPRLATIDSKAQLGARSPAGGRDTSDDEPVVHGAP